MRKNSSSSSSSLNSSFSKSVSYRYKKDGVTQSLLWNFDACPHRVKMILEGWQMLPGKEKDSLTYGSIIHFLLDKYHGLSDIKKVSQTNWKEWTKHNVDGFYKKEKVKFGAIDVLELACAKAKAVFPHYPKYWRIQDKKKTWIELEQVFKTKYEDTFLRGRRDGVFSIGKREKKWLFETKTMGRIEEASISLLLAFDFQHLFYATAYEIETGERISGIVRNIIRNPGGKPRVGESLVKYSQRISDDVIKNPEYWFIRFDINFSQETIENFQKDELPRKMSEFNKWIKELMKGEQKHALKRQCSCTGKFNCEFLSRCGLNTWSGYERTRKLFKELEE